MARKPPQIATNAEKTTGDSEKPKPAYKRGRPIEKKRKHKLQLKGWLKTQADWEKFNAWAKENSKPRKIPEPPPLVRTSKPLSKMKERINILSKPNPKPDLSKQFRFDLSVSKAALKAKPSRRIKILAKFVPKYVDYGREFPIKVTKAALNFRATPRIKIISKPKDFRTEECKDIQEKLDIVRQEDKNSKKRLALTKRALKCPEAITDEDIELLMTDTGVYRSALNYKFTPWMGFLSLPSYKFIKDRKDEKSLKLKEEYLEDLRKRGKRALIEKNRKNEIRMAKELEKKKKVAEDKNVNKGQNVDENEHQEGEKSDENDEGINESEEVEKTEEIKEVEKTEEIKEVEKTEEIEVEKTEEIKEVEKTEEIKEVEKTEEIEVEKTEEIKEVEKTEEVENVEKVKETEITEENEEDDEAAKEKWMQRNAWRFQPPPWKEGDYTQVKKSALKGPVSPRFAELAKPSPRGDNNRRKNPFGVKKSALTRPIPPRMAELAKPSHPREPIVKPPPREKDTFGRPIYPKPPYGRKMPPRIPYKEAECTDKDADDTEKNPDEKKERNEKEKKMIEKIAFESSIDPFFDPKGAQRQLEARKTVKTNIEEENSYKKDEKDEENSSKKVEMDEEI